MRTMPPVINSLIALSLLMVTPASVLAQATSPEHEAQRGTAFPECRLAGAKEVTECILYGAPVLDAPFSAEAVTAWHPRTNSGRAELRATARYYRDRAGRVRVDQFFVGQELRPQRIIVTPDPNSRAAYLLDPVARTASKAARGLGEAMVGGGGFNRFLLPLSMSRFTLFIRLPQASLHSNSTLDEESLGQRTVAGIHVTGTRFRTMLPAGAMGSLRGYEMTDERWVSSELKLVVYSRGEDSEIGVVEHQLTRINRADPPARLFEVPADYVVTAPTFPLTFENPYVRRARRLGPDLDRR